MFVNKEKINTLSFFPMLHHEESLEKLQYNMAIPPFLDTPPPPILPYLPPPFPAKIFRPPFPSILKKSNPHPPPFMKGRGISNYVNNVKDVK